MVNASLSVLVAPQINLRAVAGDREDVEFVGQVFDDVLVLVDDDHVVSVREVLRDRPADRASTNDYDAHDRSPSFIGGVYPSHYDIRSVIVRGVAWRQRFRSGVGIRSTT